MGMLVPILAAGHPLAAGLNHVCLSTGDDVQCWGFNGNGQIGDNTTITRFQAVLLDHAAVGGTVSIALGWAHTCVVRADGTMRCWGFNGNGGLGEGNFNQRLQPSVTPSVVGVTDAVEVVAGRTHTCARRSTGEVLCWGANDHGQVGDRTTDDRNVPVPVEGLSEVVALGVGDRHSFAIMANRSVKGWGRNSTATLGDGTRETRFSPVSAMTE